MDRDIVTSKIQAIAQELGEPWTFKPTRFILHKDGYEIEILTSSNVSKKDRLTIEGRYHHQGEDLMRYVGSTLKVVPTITVSVGREASAIADEIRVRFLPKYLELRAALLNQKEQALELKQIREQVAVNLCNALGARDTINKGSSVERHFPCRADRRTIAVDASVETWHRDAPEMVSVSVRGLSPQEAEELLTWTQKINPPPSEMLLEIGDEIEVTREDCKRNYEAMEWSTRGTVTSIVATHSVAHKSRPYFVTFPDRPGEWSFGDGELKKVRK